MKSRRGLWALAPSCCHGLLFTPIGGRSLWDQEGMIVNGTWYMWYDNNYCPDGSHGAGDISNYGLATSSNGVHWVDAGINMSPWGVNPCKDPSFNASIPVAGIGSGSCWEDPNEKGKYLINYSENIKGSPFGQQIRFSVSYDLKTWTPALDVPSFHEDGKLYKSGRWDTIMQFTDKQNLMHGWWTATPNSKSPPVAGVAIAAFGYGTTKDGLHWDLQPPAWVVIPQGMAGSASVEVGGVAQLPNGKWYGQACAIQWGHIDDLGGCFSVVADSPGGPFILQERNYALLGYAKTDGIPAYFSRFYVGPNGEALVNYQQGKSNTGGTFLAPLKHAVVDSFDNTTLRWIWLAANDALKGEPVARLQVDRASGMLSPALDINTGSILEGNLIWGPGAVHFCDAHGTCFGKFLLNETVMELYNTGVVKAPTSIQGIGETAAQPSRSLKIQVGDTVYLRILYRQGMYEVYFSERNDHNRTMYFAVSYSAAIPKHVNSSALKLEGAFRKLTSLAAWTFAELASQSAAVMV